MRSRSSRKSKAAGTSRREPTPLWTIGYAGRTLDGFIDALRGAGVVRVVDVRELPLSRRKGFSKTPLSLALAEAGIEYVHLRAAGNPYRTQKADILQCLKLYAGHVDKHPTVVQELIGAIGTAKTALVCFEASARECHRSVLVDRLRAQCPGLEVRHL
ncbi:MAG TPA: DUF488 domain-containing protein [Minicystis sp.]|nr:DUF488 domain-containing protein [Minicystis sp.]